MDSAVRSQLEHFFDAYPMRRAGKGQILISAHDEPTSVYHLVEGRVKQYDISLRGDEIVLNTFKPPAFFPMSIAINSTPNPYFYEAESDLVYHAVPIADTVSFVRERPDVLFDLLSRVYRGTDGLLGRLTYLMAGSARSRLLYELLIECRRFGQARGRGYVLTLNETDLAAHAGLARETVSRELSQLKAENIVSIVKQEIYVNDIERLIALVSQAL